MHYVIGFAASLVEELCINSYPIGFIIDSIKEISISGAISIQEQRL